jgi:hypothetical protein
MAETVSKLPPTPTTPSPLQKEFQYYLEHQAEFAEKHLGKFIVIKDQKVIGVFDERLEAYNETSKTHALGTFLIQQCLPGTQAYTATYHSLFV